MLRRILLSMVRSGAVFAGLLLFDSCIDRIDIFTAPVSPTNFIVDGLITNAPGPYTVKLTYPIGLDESREVPKPLQAKTVTLFDNLGNSELLHESKTGVYKTDANGMRGVIGRAYHIRIETLDGRIYESIPEKITPVGEIDSLYYEFEKIITWEGVEQQGYRIYVDADAPVSDSTFIRWRFTGTYVVETKPQHHLGNSGICSPDPLPCSGWAYVDGELKEGYAFNPLTYRYEFVLGLACTCCRCWVSPREDRPVVESTKTHANGRFNRLEVGYVPVDFYTFYEKYQVKVTQMSLSRTAYDFWLGIRQQREAISSLFNPVTGAIPGNFTEGGEASSLQGIFHASAVDTRILYLTQNTHEIHIDVPHDRCIPSRKGPIGESCLLAFPGSITTTEQPEDWE